MKKSIPYLLTLVLCFLFSSFAWATPSVMNYQGMLTTNAGVPVNTEKTITFTFWDAESNGTQLGGGFIDVDTVTPNSTGMFSTLIGDDPTNIIPDSVFETDNVYLNVMIDGENLIPRKRITSSAYSFSAGDLVCTGCVATEHLEDGSVTAAKLGSDLKVSFRVYRSMPLVVPDNTNTKVAFDTEIHDDGDVFDTTTGSFICPASGVYHFNTFVETALGSYSTAYYVKIYKNGAPLVLISTHAISTSSSSTAGGGITLKLNAGDTIDVYVWQMTGLDRNVTTTAATAWFSGFRIY